MKPKQLLSRLDHFDPSRWGDLGDSFCADGLLASEAFDVRNLSNTSGASHHLSIREVMEEECSHLKIDKKFLKEAIACEQAFVRKKPEHIEFFGGTLTGVQVVRFTDQEFNRFWCDVICNDENLLKHRLHQLATINTDFKVSSDVFNISSVWLLHAIENSPYLDKNGKKEAQLRVAMFMFYRFLTSILYNFFKYPAKKETAEVTFAQLSNRFILKTEGSWGAAIQYRASELIAETSIWRDVIDDMDDDIRVVKMINDCQGRIKSMVINIYSVFIQVHNQGKRIGSSSSMVEIDGETLLRDRADTLNKYSRYIKDTIPSWNSFYKGELVEVILSVVPTAPEHVFEEFLKWFSGNYLHIKGGRADQVISDIMDHAFIYLGENSQLLRKKEDIGTILSKMRGTYTASRGSDDLLMRIKESVEDLVKLGGRTKNPSVIAAIRTAFCLYVVIRAFTMKHYQTK
jgi:hypothetical protein